MKSYISKIFLGAAFLSMAGLSSCTGDLDQMPKDPQTIDAGKFAENPREYLGQVMGKCYSGIAVSGQGGVGGSADISGLDGGTSNWSRIIFMLNEFTTDEVSWIWPDVGVFDLCTNTWGSNNGNIYGGYSRFYTHIAICNDFIRLVRNAGSYGVNIDADLQPDVDQLVREARALRDLSYYYVIDFWGNAVVAWDDMNYGDIPQQVTRQELYDKVVADLEDVLSGFKDSNIYGRVGKDGVEALLCRFYLNAEAWGVGNSYQKCWEHAQNIISRHQGGGFQGSGLANDYLALFCRDNNMFAPGGSLTAQNEILWTIPFSYPETQSYGGTEFLIAAAVSGDMPMIYGLNGQWSSMHALKQFAEKFNFRNGVSNDGRTYLWCTENQGFTIENTNFTTFTDGYAALKFTNAKCNADGTMPRSTTEANGYTFNWAGIGDDATTGLPNANDPFPSTDFPIIRLADVYLMAAECALRGAGDKSTGLQYVNLIRSRAGISNWGDVDYTLDNLLDERSRELYWENVRRTDLIRFGKFTGSNYVWNWKNNMATGGSIPDYMKLFPLPSDVIATYGSSMKQNPGY